MIVNIRRPRRQRHPVVVVIASVSTHMWYVPFKCDILFYLCDQNHNNFATCHIEMQHNFSAFMYHDHFLGVILPSQVSTLVWQVTFFLPNVTYYFVVPLNNYCNFFVSTYMFEKFKHGTT